MPFCFHTLYVYQTEAGRAVKSLAETVKIDEFEYGSGYEIETKMNKDNEETITFPSNAPDAHAVLGR